jgi:Holliday junction resolvase RusA-like endonuclease
MASSESGAPRQREGEGAIAPGSVSIELTIAGNPIAQGSKRVFRGILVDANDKALRPWRHAVAAEATEAMAGNEPLAGPLRLDVTFTFRRPALHYGTGRNANTLKAAAPLARTAKPDLDKLLRALCDGMAGIVYRDDAQIVEVHARKLYGAPAARVVVSDGLRWIGQPKP